MSWEALKRLPFGPPAPYALYWDECRCELELWVFGRVVGFNRLAPNWETFHLSTYQWLRKNFSIEVTLHLMADCGMQPNPRFLKTYRAIETVLTGVRV